MDVNEELKFFVQIQKKKIGGVGSGGEVRGGGGEGSGWGGQGGCESRIDFFGKFQKKNWGGGGGRVGPWGGVGLGGQDGCERKIEVFVKKNIFFGGGGGPGGGGGGVGGVRVDVNQELKFLCKFKKN